MRNIFNSIYGVGGLILTLFGFGFSIFGFNEFKISYKLRNEGVKTVGIVKDRYRSSSTDHDVTVYEVGFKTIEGRNCDVKNHFGALDDLYQIGDSVEVIYLPDDPMIARFNTARELYGTYEVTGGAGLLFMSIGLILVITSYKKVDKCCNS